MGKYDNFVEIVNNHITTQKEVKNATKPNQKDKDQKKPTYQSISRKLKTRSSAMAKS